MGSRGGFEIAAFFIDMENWALGLGLLGKSFRFLSSAVDSFGSRSPVSHSDSEELVPQETLLRIIGDTALEAINEGSLARGSGLVLEVLADSMLSRGNAGFIIESSESGIPGKLTRGDKPIAALKGGKLGISRRRLGPDKLKLAFWE